MSYLKENISLPNKRSEPHFHKKYTNNISFSFASYPSPFVTTGSNVQEFMSSVLFP